MLLNFLNFNKTNMYGTGMCGYTNSYYDPTSLFMGNSIFGCPGQYDWSAMGGYQAGNFLLSAASCFLGYAVSNSKENSISNLANNVGDINAEIEAELKKLPGVNIDNYTKYDVKTEKWYKDEDKRINDSVKECKNNILDASTLEKCKKGIEDYETKQKELAACPQEEEAKKADLEKYLKDNKAQYETQKDLLKKHEEAEAKLKTLENDRKTLDDKVVTEQKKADEIIDNITRLVNERDKIEEKYVKKVFGKADGLGCRNKDLDTSKLEKGTTKFTDSDIRELCLRFPKLSEGSWEKWDCARALAELDENTFIKIASDTQIEARKLAKKYIQEHEQPEKPNATE